MKRNVARAIVLSSVSVLAVTAASAQTTTIRGGGASLPALDYDGPRAATSPTPTNTAQSELAAFNSLNTIRARFQYFLASSGRGQTAFSTNDPAALQYAGNPKPVAPIHYGASDAFLSGTSGSTVNGFTFTTVAGIPGLTADYSLRSRQDGALIQIPMLGVGIAIATSKVGSNDKLKLSENDVCGIFSGQITNFNGLANPNGLSGAITVYYRADSSGTTFLFSNHLKSVCTGSNSNFPNLAAAPTTTFTNLFNGAVPANFVGQTGSEGVATGLTGTVTSSGGSTVGQAGDKTGVGYLSPDFTALSVSGRANIVAAPNPPGGFVNTAKLFVGSVKGILPSPTQITAGLAHGTPDSTNRTPPTGTNRNNPLNWVPSIPNTTQGYSIVGYTNWLLAQCYRSANVAKGLATQGSTASFLDAHFSAQNPYAQIIANNGFGQVPSNFRTAIRSAFLTTGSSLAIKPKGTAGTCAGVTGR